MPNPFKAICCPDKKTHRDYDKRLLILGEKEIYIHCPKTGWVKLEFSRGDKKISFDNVGVVASIMPRNYHFDFDKLPVLAVGQLEQKES